MVGMLRLVAMLPKLELVGRVKELCLEEWHFRLKGG
jgi:hypothetical protein